MVGKIIVVTHKDYDMPEDNIYFPICVGREISTLSKQFQPDNSGENISRKNATYCELTAVYWAWKNLNILDFDYVDVAHYRRHFSFSKKASTLDKVVRGNELNELFAENKDKVIVTPERRYVTSIEKHYVTSLKGYEEVHKKDIVRLREAIHEYFPKYDKYADEVLTGKSAHMLNMFIMSGENFAEYCKWLFPVIDKTVELSVDREDQGRYAGALAEFCLDIWVKGKGFKVTELPLLETERVSFPRKALEYMKRKL